MYRALQYGLTFLLLFNLSVAVVHADPSLAAQADAAFRAEDWPKAAELYRKIVEAKSTNGSAWFRLGVSLVKLKKADEAETMFAKAEANGFPKAYVELGHALALASSAPEAAIQHLQGAADAGFTETRRLETEPLFNALRNAPKFAAILDKVRKNEMPCVYAPENRQFDFWLGEWNVVVSGTDAPQVGTSKIESILNQCVVLENWTSARPPYAGKSFNIYNTNLKRWEQYWVDNTGGNIFFHGNLQNGVMDYWTDDITQADGKLLRRHLQFFKLDADTVRQFSQGSNDRGKTWSPEYDFTYHRKK